MIIKIILSPPYHMLILSRIGKSVYTIFLYIHAKSYYHLSCRIASQAVMWKQLAAPKLEGVIATNITTMLEAEGRKRKRWKRQKIQPLPHPRLQHSNLHDPRG